MKVLQNSKNTRISAILPKFLVLEMKKISEEENVTQSSIIKKALTEWLKKKLDRDTKALAALDFDDLPSEDEWDIIQSPI
ncbi:DUF2191 domain-containing protein [Candidatus Peregrinibacteria bacterium]|nr:DUF2191 domain-containing protein [Candidatus Peregrinibacteria bacterium]